MALSFFRYKVIISGAGFFFSHRAASHTHISKVCASCRPTINNKKEHSWHEQHSEFMLALAKMMLVANLNKVGSLPGPCY